MNKGQFKKGSIPWNKGLKGFMAGHKHGFQLGHLPVNTTKPEGTISIHYKKGVPDSVHINIDWKGNRKPKNIFAWYIWEVANQKDRPKGYVIYHLDEDRLNNDISNLKPITRAELARINRLKNL